MKGMLSIIIPVFNAAAFIGPCLESVVSQDHPHVEVIVIDGGSTDGTADTIASYADRLTYYVSESDRGQSHAINKGFAKATGDILAWLNADEEYLPGALSTVASLFAATPDLDLVYGDRMICDEQGREIGRIQYPRMHPHRYTLYAGRVLPTEATFWSRRVHELTGALDEEHFQHLAMDYDWFLRMGAHVRRYHKLDGPLAKFKEHVQRKTSRTGRDEMEALWRTARGNYLRQHPHPRSQLALGWVAAGLSARVQLGNLSVPRLATLLKVSDTMTVESGRDI